MNNQSALFAGIAILAFSVALSGCATPQAPAPIVDTKAFGDPERMASYKKDEKECRLIQIKAMPVKLLEALGTNDVQAYNARREEKAATIMRNCLNGRGYAVLY